MWPNLRDTTLTFSLQGLRNLTFGYGNFFWNIFFKYKILIFKIYKMKEKRAQMRAISNFFMFFFFSFCVNFNFFKFISPR